MNFEECTYSLSYCHWYTSISTQAWHKEIVLLTGVCGFCWYQWSLSNSSAVQEWVVDVLMNEPAFFHMILSTHSWNKDQTNITAIKKSINNIQIQERNRKQNHLPDMKVWNKNIQKQEQPDALWELLRMHMQMRRQQVGKSCGLCWSITLSH